MPQRFLRLPAEAIPGIVLLLSAAAAMVIANSPWAEGYAALLKTEAFVGFGAAAIRMTLAEWVKNALMAVFFLFAGLELKRELLEGALADRRAAALPFAAAVGGMAVPALIFVVVAGAPYAHGWAIPAATDIAFALGVLALLGSRVPAALKAFLLAVAIIDDLGAILIVAFAYSGALHWDWLTVAGGVFALMLGLNRMQSGRLGLYLLLALPLWVAVQNSGVNPTMAGVLTAVAIPLRDRDGGAPLHAAEHGLRAYVLFLVMPVFALASAGASLTGGFGAALGHPVALGIAAGLALGKPIGITLVTLLTARLIGAPLPGKPIHIIGLGAMAGIGFTMSLFIGKLAFADPALATPVKLGVYMGSLAAALAGLLILSRTLPRRSARRVAAEHDETRPFIAEEPGRETGRTPF
ncbi:Na+/H+ antiporter NhaA [Sandaracinobacteroides saxicola]|uniref:Na(+)/H(+) antiporter NhaA n=1 Tax=Sandaracinobacteroides saxicola TaxID=2759707 RepID=A0A7G5ILQ7_9SPHN|nr:Na+/H+ antiporter NhaA [Sandaracinobacteroides saxicola]QMW24299.1 Na+/H+ antiporter NhaA [Sandaracinobacteroides saxicola]